MFLVNSRMIGDSMWLSHSGNIVRVISFELAKYLTNVWKMLKFIETETMHKITSWLAIYFSLLLSQIMQFHWENPTKYLKKEKKHTHTSVHDCYKSFNWDEICAKSKVHVGTHGKIQNKNYSKSTKKTPFFCFVLFCLH